MRSNIIFIGEENKINNELYQLLNWRFNVTSYFGDDITLAEISVLNSASGDRS